MDSTPASKSFIKRFLCIRKISLAATVARLQRRGYFRHGYLQEAAGVCRTSKARFKGVMLADAATAWESQIVSNKMTSCRSLPVADFPRVVSRFSRFSDELTNLLACRHLDSAPATRGRKTYKSVCGFGGTKSCYQDRRYLRTVVPAQRQVLGRNIEGGLL